MRNDEGLSALSTTCLSSVIVLCPDADAVGGAGGMQGGTSTGEGGETGGGLQGVFVTFAKRLYSAVRSPWVLLYEHL